MYWNNPIIRQTWPYDQDPIEMAKHQGRHCLLWNPAAPIDNILTNQRLQDLCDWANYGLKNNKDLFLQDPLNHYDIANLVKLNMWIHSIRVQGIVKPWLIQDQGDGTFIAGTGDSRLRCLERIPEITTVKAFISTHVDRRHLYPDLEEVTNFDQFIKLCNTEPQREFLFRLTDPQAPYGLYWFEFDSERTRAITPGEQQSVALFCNYLKTNPDIVFTPEWFDTLKPWQDTSSS